MTYQSHSFKPTGRLRTHNRLAHIRHLFILVFYVDYSPFQPKTLPRKMPFYRAVILSSPPWNLEFCSLFGWFEFEPRLHFTALNMTYLLIPLLLILFWWRRRRRRRRRDDDVVTTSWRQRRDDVVTTSSLRRRRRRHDEICYVDADCASKVRYLTKYPNFSI